MKERPALRKKIDALYAAPPGEFVAARKALAKELKGDGKADEAEHVAALKKPTVAAALINRLARERPDEMKEFATAAAALRKASGKRLREAARAEREAAATLVEAADELMAEEGGAGVSPHATGSSRRFRPPRPTPASRSSSSPAGSTRSAASPASASPSGPMGAGERRTPAKATMRGSRRPSAGGASVGSRRPRSGFTRRRRG